VSDNDAFPGPDDAREEAVGAALADYLALVEETIRAQVTDDDIRDRVRRAMDLAASAQDRTPDRTWRHDFSDRHLLLDELLALMGDPRQGPAVLAGPGGTGKSTVAAALAERARALGRDVWWISASNPVTLLRGLSAVARQLGDAGDVDAVAKGEADAADRFWRLLDNASSEWLLIFDEADDPQALAAGGSPAGVQDLTGWVRSSARGLALVTSRETDLRMWEAARLLRVGELPEADAVQMLLALAPAAGEENEARALARRLGGHPLSLRLAGSFLHSQAAHGATFAAYERRLDEQLRADLHGRPARDVPAPPPVPAVHALELSLGRLAEEGIPQTRPVLQLASCYAPAPIPASLLNARSLTETGLLADFGDPSPTAEDRAEEALRELQITGILEPADDGIALHTVIIEAGRASMDGSVQASTRIRHAAIELLHGCTSKLPYEEPESWSHYLLLGPHLLSLLDTLADQVDPEHLGMLMETTARVTGAFNLSGMSRAGIILGERALARSAPLGPGHRAVLRVRHSITWAVAYHGDLSTAEAWYRENLQTQLRVFGPEDHDVLRSRHELAWIAACRGDWATAEAGYRAAFGDSVRIQGPDHPRTLLTRHELAWAIANQEQSRLGEAREIFAAVLSDRHRVLGAEHPRTLTTLHELAWISAQEGQWEQAETAYRELLALRARVIGEDHPDTMVIRHELAWIAARRGRTAEAESRYTDVLDQRRRILGEEHPDTLATQRARDELRCGRIVDARHVA
jgi:hypothetical protein